MKIAVVGLGVAGAYLTSRLVDSHQVIGFERFTRERFDAVCAWGTAKGGIKEYSKKVGLNFEDYILHDGREMQVDLGGVDLWIRLKGLCTFDKKRFVEDMVNAHEVRFGCDIRRLPAGDFDLVMDATGLYRPLLPPIKRDTWIPTLQYLVKFQEPPFDDFYIRPSPGLTGYLWYFPLGNGYAHVGAGDYYKRHLAYLEEFMNRYRGEVVKRVGRPIRITPPALAEPFYQGRVIGVGESIGTVYPLLGEGIIPSLKCAELLVESSLEAEPYRRRVLEEFQVYIKVYNFIKSRLQGSSLLRQLSNLAAVYRHMKGQEDRYGMEIRARDFLKVVFGRHGRALRASISSGA